MKNKNKLTVKLPDWWVSEESSCSNPSEIVLGFTDGTVEYLCSQTACYYVEVPEYEYNGYFKVKDLKVIK